MGLMDQGLMWGCLFPVALTLRTGIPSSATGWSTPPTPNCRYRSAPSTAQGREAGRGQTLGSARVPPLPPCPSCRGDPTMLTLVFSCKLHGAAYGKGIYLSPISSISFGYSGKRLPALPGPACAAQSCLCSHSHSLHGPGEVQHRAGRSGSISYPSHHTNLFPARLGLSHTPKNQTPIF